MEEEFVIDCGPLGGGVSGAGRYAFNLVDELLILVIDIPFRLLVPPPENHDWDTSGWGNHDNVRVETVDITGLGLNRLWYYLRSRPNCRAHHSLSSYVPWSLDSDRSLVTIHDLKYFKLADSLRGKSWSKRAYVKRHIAQSVRVADHIITVSESTKADIVDEFGVDAAGVSVVPLGPDGGLRSVTADPPVEPPFVLFVGAVRRHKNVATLIEGYQQYRRQTAADLSLAIAGRPAGR